MFQIPTSPAPRAAVSALSALAALGASGMATAAPVELEPAVGAYALNTWSMKTASGMKDWLTAVSPNYLGSAPSFARWGIDLVGNNITSALYRVDAHNNSFNYGIPLGATLNFALITEPWDPGVAAAQETGPNYGTNLGVDALEFTSTSATGDADYDITTLLQTWDASPNDYHGVRFFVTQGSAVPSDPENLTFRGGVKSPLDSYSGNLSVDMTAVPEPSAIAAIGTIGLLAIRRRKA